MGRFLAGVGLLAVLSLAVAAAAQAEEGGPPAAYPAAYEKQPAWPPRPQAKRWLVRVEVGGGCVQGPEGILGEPLAPGTAGLDWGDLGCSTGVAARLTLGYRCGPANLFELRGAGIDAVVNDSRQSGFFAFDNLPGVSPAVSATLEHDASLLSVELNYWRRLFGGGCIQMRGGLGARYLRLDDTAIARDWAGLAPSAYLQSEGENSLWAGQLLASIAWTPSRFEVELSGRAFAGSLNRRVRIDDDSILSGGAKTAEEEETEFGWGFEAGLDIRYRINACVALTLGYAYIYMDEVVRGSDSMDFGQAISGAVQVRNGLDSVCTQALYLGIQLDI